MSNIMTRDTEASDPEISQSRNQSLLRAEDHDRFLVTMFVPKVQRATLTALYALNIEIAKTRTVVSEPALGEIRLAWWREAVSDMTSGNIRRHDILEQLAGQALREDELHTLIDGRKPDLYRETMRDVESLISYAVNTSGQLEGMAARLTGGEDEEIISARKIGTAWALIGMMRAIPHNMGQNTDQRWNYLPQDRMTEWGLTDPTSVEPDQRAGLREIVDQVCDIAAHLLDDATAARQTPASKLLASLGLSYLKVLKKAGYDPYTANFDRGAMGRFIKLAWQSARQ
jgi:phytoene/squalene synthetase